VPLERTGAAEGDMRGSHRLRAGGYLARRVSELDDGTVLAEITALCEYVDEKKKDTPSLIGDTPEERAKKRTSLRNARMLFDWPAICLDAGPSGPPR
jgi:hypothetical protein